MVTLPPGISLLVLLYSRCNSRDTKPQWSLYYHGHPTTMGTLLSWLPYYQGYLYWRYYTPDVTLGVPCHNGHPTTMVTLPLGISLLVLIYNRCNPRGTKPQWSLYYHGHPTTMVTLLLWLPYQLGYLYWCYYTPDVTLGVPSHNDHPTICTICIMVTSPYRISHY